MEDTPKIHDVRDDSNVHSGDRVGHEFGRLEHSAERNDFSGQRSDDGGLCSMAREREKVMWDMFNRTTAEQAAENRRRAT